MEEGMHLGVRCRNMCENNQNTLKKLSQNWAAIQLFEKEILPPKQNKLKFVQLDYSACNMWISQIKPSIHILFTY